MPFKALDDHHTTATRGTGEAEDPRIMMFRRGVMIMVWRRCVEQGSKVVEIGGALAVGEQAVMSDPVEPIWEDMDEKASNELNRFKGHGPLPIATVGAVVFVSEGNAIFVDLDQPAVGDGDAMSIAAKIGQCGAWSCERFFTVDEPFCLLERCQVSGEGRWVAETGLLAEEAEFVFAVSRFELLQHQPAKEAGEDTDRQDFD